MPQEGTAELDRPGVPEDRFEREVGRSPIFGPIGAIGWGVLTFVLLQSGQGTGPADFAASIASGVFIACYVFFVGRQILIRWLITKRSWPYGARRVILAGGLPGLPLLAYWLAGPKPSEVVTVYLQVGPDAFIPYVWAHCCLMPDW